MFRLLKLEDRIVLSGDVGIEAIDHIDHHDATMDEANDHDQAQDDGDDSIDAHFTPDDAEAAPEAVNVLVVATDTTPDADDLVKAAKKDVVVVEFSAEDADLSDLSDAIAKALDGRKADSIAIAASGTGAGFNLGDGIVTDFKALDSDADQQAFYSALGESLTDDGRLDLLACNVAGDPTGGAFLAKMETLTGHNVAASTDVTGNEAYGGDWVLETDDVDIAGTYFDAHKLDKYTGALAAPEVIGDVPNLSPDASGRLAFGFNVARVWDDPEGNSFNISKTALSTLPTGIKFYPQSTFYGRTTTFNGQNYTVNLVATDSTGAVSAPVDVIIAVPNTGETTPLFTAASYDAGTFDESPVSGFGTQIYDLGTLVNNVEGGLADLQFRIVSGNPVANDGSTPTFAIDNNGVITLNNTDRFDYEDAANPNHEFSLRVEAREVSQGQSGLYANTTVNFKLDDVEPEIVKTPSATLSLASGAPATIFEWQGISTTMQVNLNQAVTADTTISLTYSGSATRDDGVAANPDFSAPATVTVLKDASTATFKIAPINDGVKNDDGAETVTVTLQSGGAGAGYLVGADPSETVTISDVDAVGLPTVQIAVNNPSVAEGSTSVITATMSETRTVDTTVTLSFNQADDGDTFADYSVPRQFITILANQTTGKLTLTALEDQVDPEADETVTVTVQPTADYAVGPADQQSITITNAPPPVLPSLYLKASKTDIDENGGEAVITATLTQAAPENIVVTLGGFDQGTAAKGNVGDPPDPLTNDYSLSNETIVIQKDDFTGTAVLKAVGDFDPLEGDETAVVQILSAVVEGTTNQGATIITPDKVTVNILEGSEPNVEFGPGDFSIPETGGVATFDLTLTPDSTTSVTVTIDTAGSTAVEGAAGDYTIEVNGDPTPLVGTTFDVVFAPTETAKTIKITPVDDPDFENDETATFKITGVTGAQEIGDLTHVVTIEANDTGNRPVIDLIGTGVTFNESGGQASAFLQADQTVTQAVQVTLDVAGMAVLDEDFTATVGGVSVVDTATGQLKIDFSSGTLLEVKFTGITDTKVEGAETFGLTLTSVDANGVLGTSSDPVFTITDQTTPPTAIGVSVEATDLQPTGTPAELSENGGYATMLATMTLAPGTTLDTSFTLFIQPSPPQASAFDDYTLYGDAALTQELPLNIDGDKWLLSFTPTDLAAGGKEFYVGGLDDGLSEGNETFTLTVGADGLAPTGTAGLTIVDDESGDDAILNVEASIGTVIENSATNASQITLSLVDALGAPLAVAGDVTVEVTLSGTGNGVIGQVVSGTDFTVTDALGADMDPDADGKFTIIFSEGETQKTYTLTALADATPIFEGDETVDITGAVLAGKAVGPYTAQVIIQDEFGSPTVTLGTVGAASFPEDVSPKVITGTLSNATVYDVLVDLSFTDVSTEAVPEDYDYNMPAQMKINAGNPQGFFSVNIVDDTLLEGDETFEVNITNVDQGSGTGTGLLSLVIQDDTAELNLPPQVSIALVDTAPVTITEGIGSTDLAISVDRSFTTTMTVTLTMSGTAEFDEAPADQDYTLSATDPRVAGIVRDDASNTFAIKLSPGDAITDLPVTVTGLTDILNEADETIVASASIAGGIGGGLSLPAVLVDPTATYTITLADDTPLPEIVLSFKDGIDTIYEGGTPDVTYVVASLVDAIGGAPVLATATITVTLAVETDPAGDGVIPPDANQDFFRDFTNWNLIILPNESSGSFKLTAEDDTTFEVTESFTVSVAVDGGTGDPLVAGPAQNAVDDSIVFKIEDNDPAPYLVLNPAAPGDIGEDGIPATTTTVELQLLDLPLADPLATTTASIGTVTATINLADTGTVATLGDPDFNITVDGVAPAVGTFGNSSTFEVNGDTLTITWTKEDQGFGIPIEFTVFNDLRKEGDEPVNLRLTGTNENAQIDPAADAASFSVIDNDFEKSEVTLTAQDSGITEGPSDPGVLKLKYDITTGLASELMLQFQNLGTVSPVTPADFTLLYADGNGTVTLSLTLTDDNGTPADPLDDTYELTSPLTVPSGANEGTLFFQAPLDSVFEGTESFKVTISEVDPTRMTLGATASQTMTITDGDGTPSYTLSTTTGSFAEDGLASLPVTVELVGPATGFDVEVDIQITETGTNVARFTDGGAAYSAADYVVLDTDGATDITPAGPTTGTFTITIPAGQTSATFYLNGAGDDGIFEVTEDLPLTILEATDTAGGSALTAGTTTSATYTVTDVNGDLKPEANLTTISGTPLTEGVGSATFLVSLSEPIGSTTTVTLTYSGEAVEGAANDYTAVPNPLVAFLPGSPTTQLVTLTAFTGDGYEPNETFTVTIDANDDYYTLGTASSQTGEIIDGDGKPSVSIVASPAAPLSIGENLQLATFTLELSSESAVSTSVLVALDTGTSTATLGDDFIVIGATGPGPNPGEYYVELPAGPAGTQATFQIRAVDDEVYEGGAGTFESVIFTIPDPGPTADYTPAATSSATTNIEDDESPPVLTFAVTDSLNEGDAGSIVVTQSIASDLTTELTLSFTDGVLPGFASFTDYEVDGASPTGAGTITFLITPDDGQTITIPLSAVTDALFEGDELFTVDIAATAPVNATWAVTQTSESVTIVDQTPPPEVALSYTGTLTVSEPATPAPPPFTATATLTVNVTLGGTQAYQDEVVIVRYTGDADADFSDGGGEVEVDAGLGTIDLVAGDTFEVTISTGASSAPINVTLHDPDLVWNPDRSFGFEIVGMQDPASLVTNTVPDTVDITITDTDAKYQVSLTVDTSDIGEEEDVVQVNAILVDSLGAPVNALYSVEVTLTGEPLGFTPPPEATLGSDYNALTQKLVIPVGFSQSGLQPAFASIIDGDYEGNEYFKITAVTNGTADWDGSAPVIQILDNDPGPTVTLTVDDTGFTEDTGRATVTLNFTEESPNDEIVFVSVAGTADPDTDFFGPGFREPVVDDYYASYNSAGGDVDDLFYITDYDPGVDVWVVEVPANTLSFSFYLFPIDDTPGYYDGPVDETVEMGIYDFSNPLTLGATTTGTATLVDNDLDKAPTVSLGATTVEINEDTTAPTTTTFTLTLSNPATTNGPVDVVLAIGGTATLDDGVTTTPDYELLVGGVSAVPTGGLLDVTIGTGTTTVTLTVKAGPDDSLYEGDETVSVTIDSVTAGGIADPAASDLTITIKDEGDLSTLDLVPNPTAAAAVTEDSSNDTVETTGPFFSIDKVGDSAGSQLVFYTVDTDASTAEYGVDFTIDGYDPVAEEGFLTVSSGAGSYNLPNVSIVADDLDEGDETIVLKITDIQPAGGGVDDTATLTIIDNDVTPAATGDLTLNGFDEGAVVQLTTADLNVIDGDTDEGALNAGALTISIVDMPSAGILFIDLGGTVGEYDDGTDTVFGPGGTFTLQDVIDGKIYYDHYGPAATAPVNPNPGADEVMNDSFTFLISDGTNISDSDAGTPDVDEPYTISITATPTPEDFVSWNDVFWVVENTTGQLFQSEADALAGTGPEAVIATDQDGNTGLTGNSTFTMNPNNDFALNISATDGEAMVLELVAPLDFEGVASALVMVEVFDGDTLSGPVVRSYLVNVLNDPNDDGYTPGTIADATWTPAEDGAFIYPIDPDAVFPKPGEKLLVASGMPSWLNFQTTNSVFWALPGAAGVPTTTTTEVVTLTATYYDGNGQVQDSVSVDFDLQVIVASLDKGLILDALEYLDEAPADLPEADQAVEIHEMMITDTGDDAMMNPYAEALALLDGELDPAAA